MPRYESIDSGDVQVRHPRCGTPLLITDEHLGGRDIVMVIEGLCLVCDCYVRLRWLRDYARHRTHRDWSDPRADLLPRLEAAIDRELTRLTVENLQSTIAGLPSVRPAPLSASLAEPFTIGSWLDELRRAGLPGDPCV